MKRISAGLSRCASGYFVRPVSGLLYRRSGLSRNEQTSQSINRQKWEVGALPVQGGMWLSGVLETGAYRPAAERGWRDILSSTGKQQHLARGDSSSVRGQEKQRHCISSPSSDMYLTPPRHVSSAPAFEAKHYHFTHVRPVYGIHQDRQGLCADASESSPREGLAIQSDGGGAGQGSHVCEMNPDFSVSVSGHPVCSVPTLSHRISALSLHEEMRQFKDSQSLGSVAATSHVERGVYEKTDAKIVVGKDFANMGVNRANAKIVGVRESVNTAEGDMCARSAEGSRFAFMNV
uniref:Uncharacterized protein n=1 Tax=Chromera velia CCMP2878 TaxID=1169474 RepID=A0A0G4GET5_9ALVE|eukprot:Cvel_21570.t1-p1 / transcript=Cvel_21570.t1 / gene=Cvel_21570 / organism=Chromera_velia_CCMP2878 / gene_product=hypothetical protein / transcript_product=hypothetical protein / location=Cvel_scaffold2035:4846-6223(-) / protein_length=290 / sequence_SO=supercontig / SO=protein_coding / is_pseudo=false